MRLVQVLIPADKQEALDALQKVMVDKIFGGAGDECVVEVRTCFVCIGLKLVSL